MLCALLLALTPGGAVAATVEVVSVADPVAVALDDAFLGTTPLTTADLPPGTHTFSFRAAPWAPVAFSEAVEVPAAGSLTLRVDLATRTASLEGQSPGSVEPVETAEAPPGEEVAHVEDPPPAPPPPALGDLFVTSEPGGGIVFLDGVSTGQATPALFQGLPPAAYAVEVRTPCARATAEATVRDDAIARAELILVEGLGAVAVVSDPPGAALRVDDGEPLVTPATVEGLPCGEHGLVVRAPGHLEVRETIQVVAYEAATVAVTLPEERFGVLTVAPSPLSALVELDGIPVGTGPRTVEQVAAGQHDLAVLAEGYTTDRRTVKVEPDQALRIDVVLTPAPSSPAWGRIALDVGVTGAGLGLGVAAAGSYQRAGEAYDRFLAVPDDDAAQVIYEEEVRPAWTAAYLEAGGAAALLLGSVWLWTSTDFMIAPAPGGVAVAGRW